MDLFDGRPREIDGIVPFIRFNFQRQSDTAGTVLRASDADSFTRALFPGVGVRSYNCVLHYTGGEPRSTLKWYCSEAGPCRRGGRELTGKYQILVQSGDTVPEVNVQSVH